jgi:hypothetical protein
MALASAFPGVSVRGGVPVAARHPSRHQPEHEGRRRKAELARNPAHEGLFGRGAYPVALAARKRL